MGLFNKVHGRIWGFPEFWAHKWMVYFMENLNKMDDDWGTPVDGNLHILVENP